MTQDILIILATIALVIASVWWVAKRDWSGRKARKVAAPAPATPAAKPAVTLTVRAELVDLSAADLAALRRDEQFWPRPPPPPENADTAREAAWGQVIDLNLPIEIDYLSQKGELTHRRVMVLAAEGNQGPRFAEGWATRFRGWCLLANARREFRVDGVMRLADPTTGELAETPATVARLLARRIGEEVAAGRGRSRST